MAFGGSEKKYIMYMSHFPRPWYKKQTSLKNHKIFPKQQLVLYMDDSSKALQSRFYKATEKEELKQRQEKRKKLLTSRWGL